MERVVKFQGGYKITYRLWIICCYRSSCSMPLDILNTWLFDFSLTPCLKILQHLTISPFLKVFWFSPPFRHQGCGDQGSIGSGPLCSKLSLRLCNSSVNTTGAGHEGDQGEPVAELPGYCLDQLEDLARHSADQLLLCTFPASDSGEWDLKHFLFINHVYSAGCQYWLILN